MLDHAENFLLLQEKNMSFGPIHPNILFNTISNTSFLENKVKVTINY